MQNSDPAITNGLRNKSKGEADPDSNRTPKVDFKKKKHSAPDNVTQAPYWMKASPPSLGNKRTLKPNITADEDRARNMLFLCFIFCLCLFVFSIFFMRHKRHFAAKEGEM